MAKLEECSEDEGGVQRKGGVSTVLIARPELCLVSRGRRAHRIAASLRQLAPRMHIVSWCLLQFTRAQACFIRPDLSDRRRTMKSRLTPNFISALCCARVIVCSCSASEETPPSFVAAHRELHRQSQSDSLRV